MSASGDESSPETASPPPDLNDDSSGNQKRNSSRVGDDTTCATPPLPRTRRPRRDESWVQWVGRGARNVQRVVREYAKLFVILLSISTACVKTANSYRAELEELWVEAQPLVRHLKELAKPLTDRVNTVMEPLLEILGRAGETVLTTAASILSYVGERLSSFVEFLTPKPKPPEVADEAPVLDKLQHIKPRKPTGNRSDGKVVGTKAPPAPIYTSFKYNKCTEMRNMNVATFNGTINLLAKSSKMPPDTKEFILHGAGMNSLIDSDRVFENGPRGMFHISTFAVMKNNQSNIDVALAVFHIEWQNMDQNTDLILLAKELYDTRETNDGGKKIAFNELREKEQKNWMEAAASLKKLNTNTVMTDEDVDYYIDRFHNAAAVAFERSCYDSFVKQKH